MFDFLKNKIGNDKFNLLFKELDSNENPMESINNYEFLQKVVGKKKK